MTNNINFNTNPVRFTHPLFTLSVTVYALKKSVISACFAQRLLRSMFETHLSMSQSLLRTSSKPGCPCRKCRNVSQADRAMSTEGGSIVVSSACSLSSSSFCSHQNFVPKGCLPLPRGYIYIYIKAWTNMYKIRLQIGFSWNLQQMGKVIRPFYWHQHFVPKGLSVPALWLYKGCSESSSRNSS